MSIEELPSVIAVTKQTEGNGASHPMRAVTNEVAAGGGWDSSIAAEVGSFFDGLAPEWVEKRKHRSRELPVIDSLERGGVEFATNWLELGCGTGSATAILAPRVDSLVAVDLSAGMLQHAPEELGPFVRADASTLPFRDSEFGGVMLMNMFLFPTELDRVLAEDGWIIWVNSRAEQTPIHLSVDALIDALPGEWRGFTSRADTGMWATLTRKASR